MMQRYAKAYFGKAGKAQPVIHTMLLVGGLGYLIEYPHLSAFFDSFSQLYSLALQSTSRMPPAPPPRASTTSSAPAFPRHL